jgi:hypothetical protein
MLNSKLKRGMTMIQVVTLTQSLGRRMAENPETWSWADEGRSSVTLVFDNGRLARWTLDRPVEP